MRDMRRTVLRVAAVQMTSGADVGENLRAAERLTTAAAAQGAGLVLLPENFGLMGAHARDKLAAQEPDGEGPQQAFLARMAETHGVYMIGGSVPIACDDAERTKQSLLVYGPDGTRVARYDKIHLFRFTHGDEDYDEAKTIVPGRQPVTFVAPCGAVGLSICYDLRFPELYRALDDVALLVVPAAFTARTGEAHWQTLLRARAIENQCYVLAAAQWGTHAGGRRTWGHSMLVDPWGEIIAEKAEGEGIAVGDVDPVRISDVRSRLPALSHRTLHAGAMTDSISPQAPLLRGFVVLVVDDDADGRDMAARVVESLGSSVLVASSAEEALAILDSGAHVDVVFSDVVMPHSSGVTLASVVRERRPGMPVVLATGYPDAVDAVTESGAIPLIKPYSISRLEAVLAEQLHVGRP
jgi:deaminated glutathione amidase